MPPPPASVSREANKDNVWGPKFQKPLPEFMNFKLFGKTILVVNKKFGLFWGHPLSR